MTDYLAAAKRGDWDTAFGYFAEDMVMHIPGRSSFAGDLQGKEAAVRYIEAIRSHYPDGKIEVELIDMLTSDERRARRAARARALPWRGRAARDPPRERLPRRERRDRRDLDLRGGSVHGRRAGAPGGPRLTRTRPVDQLSPRARSTPPRRSPARSAGVRTTRRRSGAAHLP